MTPTISNARVIAVDVPNRRLTVELPSRQVVTVRMMFHGPADGVRVGHPAMPGRFTDGIVVFPVNDNRNGFWLGSVYMSQMDALTTNTDQFLEYNSHWSGAYEMMDGEGRWTKSFPDGTFIQCSDGTTKPTTFRHTVDGQQNQQLTHFPESQRVPNPPAPRHLYVGHSSGTTFDIDPSGNVSLDGAKNASCTVTFNGGTIVIDGNGSITATAPSGQQITLDANGGTIQINKNGAINVNAAGGQHLNVSAGGAGVSYTLVRTDLLVAAFNGHVHSNGNQGSNTGTPVAPISAAGIQSAMANVSE